ncbi:hypothetical protein C9374_006248 [Naegleria lovaniensis]|uniref:BTB domain-containing protein n=1 Tax=Naegleria lovaniensis TaxID=51637 RepID=A0AA88KH13_NAELO|nr:uncharacterized protein C9374_006248 [Naegleria lovaniensis]KAG2381259.1 hypothetical protein C9374_006248 [Naegleria lovaniensis]
MSSSRNTSASTLLLHLTGEDEYSEEEEEDEPYSSHEEEVDDEQLVDDEWYAPSVGSNQNKENQQQPHDEESSSLWDTQGVDILKLASSQKLDPSNSKHHSLKQFLKSTQPSKKKASPSQIIPMTDPKEIELFYEQLKIIKKDHHEDDEKHPALNFSLHHFSLQSPLSQTATSNKCSISLFNEHANTLKIYSHGISDRYVQACKRALNDRPPQVKPKAFLKTLYPDYKQMKYQVDRKEMRELNFSKLLGYATCYIPKLNSIFIHGGTNQSTNAQSNDVYIYNIHQNSFHILDFLNQTNNRRYHSCYYQGMSKHFMIYVAQKDCILIFGGGTVKALTFKKVLSLSSQRNGSGLSSSHSTSSSNAVATNSFDEMIHHLKWGIKQYDQYAQKFFYSQSVIPFLNQASFDFSEYCNFQHVLDPSTLTLYLFGGKFKRSHHRELDESHLIFKIEIVPQTNALVIGNQHFPVAFQLSILIPSHKYQSYSSKILNFPHNRCSFQSNSLICMKCSDSDEANNHTTTSLGAIPVTSTTIASLLSHRKHMSTCFVPSTHEIYFYGGHEQNQWRNEMYCFNTELNRWSMMDMNYSYLDIESPISTSLMNIHSAATDSTTHTKIPQLTPNPRRIVPTMTVNYDSKSMLLFDRIDGSIYCYSFSQSSSGKQSAWSVIHPLGIQSHTDYINCSRILPTQNIVSQPYQTMPQSYYQVLRVGEKLYILNTTTSTMSGTENSGNTSGRNSLYSCKHFFPIQILTNPIVNTNDINILSHISSIYRSQEYVDVKFVVKKFKKNDSSGGCNSGNGNENHLDEYEYFTGHKSIISCRCSYLKELIQQSNYYEEDNDSNKNYYYQSSNNSNTRMLIVKIEDATSDLFKAILDFIYLGEVHLHEDDSASMLNDTAMNDNIQKEAEKFTIVNRFLSICKKWNFKSEFFESLCQFDQSIHLDVYTRIISDFERDIASMVNSNESFADVKIILEDEDYIEGEEDEMKLLTEHLKNMNSQEETYDEEGEQEMENIIELPVPHQCHYEMVQVHKCMIIRSPFFAKMFEHGFTESLTNTIRFKSNVLDKNALIQVLHYIYTDRSTEITPANCIGILVYSQMFGLSQLASNCRNMIRANLTPHNCAAILEIAQVYKDQALEREVIEYICKNTEACDLILQSDHVSTESKLAIKKKLKK